MSVKYYQIKRQWLDKEGVLPKLKSPYLSNKKELISQFNWDEVVTQNLVFDYLNVYYEENESTQICDMMEWGALNTENWVVSRRFKELLQQFNLGNHNFFYCKVLDDKKILDYYIFQFINKFYDTLNFEHSVFTEWKTSLENPANKNNYKLNSSDEFKKLAINLRRSEERYYLGLKHASIKNKYKHWDLFDLPVIGPVVSESLYKEIIRQNITGVELSEVNQVTFSFD